MMSTKRAPWPVGLALTTTAMVLTSTGCLADVEHFQDEEDELEDVDDASAASNEFRIADGLHGVLNGNAEVGGVVDQHLVEQLPSNHSHQFWWFCGQAATATAINFARGDTPNQTTKISQLHWFHERLLARESYYSVDDSAGPYAAHITWLYDLMEDEKSGEFQMSSLTTASRDAIKSSMLNALDEGAYVVALNQTDWGVGHYLTVYAIDYQPAQAGGGTVYYGDVFFGNLDFEDFTTFLDRMKNQSAFGLYNAFTVKKQ